MKITFELLNLLTAKYPPGEHEGHTRHHAIMIMDGVLTIQLVFDDQWQTIQIEAVDFTKDAQTLFDEIVAAMPQ